MMKSNRMRWVGNVARVGEMRNSYKILVRITAGAGDFSLHHVRQVLGPTQPLIQWEPGAPPLVIKRQVFEADNSPPSSASTLRMRDTIPPLPQYVFMAWCLVKYRDKFNFYLTWREETSWEKQVYMIRCKDV
jgi:hypothetical protein